VLARPTRAALLPVAGDPFKKGGHDNRAGGGDAEGANDGSSAAPPFPCRSGKLRVKNSF